MLKTPKVLVACEYSGIVRDAFLARGFDAWSCDILPTESRPWRHIQCNVFTILDDGWNLMIAHPPCTYISNLGAPLLMYRGSLDATRFKLGQEGARFFRKLLDAPIAKIAVENPLPSKIFELPSYHQRVQPWMFGDDTYKSICLWLKNLPPLFPTEIVLYPQPLYQIGGWYNKGRADGQKERARFFPGIAKAMAEQWGKLL